MVLPPCTARDLLLSRSRTECATMGGAWPANRPGREVWEMAGCIRETAGCIRPPAVRRVVATVGTVGAVWLLWRLISPGAPPAEVMASVLGWGLGVVPFHVTLGKPQQGETGPRTEVRRPAQTYERERAAGRPDPDRRTGPRERRVRHWGRRGPG